MSFEVNEVVGTVPIFPLDKKEHPLTIMDKAEMSTFEPNDMDRLLEDGLYQVTVTDKIDIQQPTAKTIVEIANTQDHGTTTIAALAEGWFSTVDELHIEKTLPLTQQDEESGFQRVWRRVEQAYEELEKIQGIFSDHWKILDALLPKKMFKLIGSTWETNSFAFWIRLFIDKNKNEMKISCIRNETDKIKDSKKNFQNLKLPPPGIQNHFFTSLIDGSTCVRKCSNMLAIGGVKAGMPLSIKKQNPGGFKCKESKRSSRKPYNPWKRPIRRLEKKPKGSSKKCLNLSEKTLKLKKELSQHCAGSVNSPLTEDTLRHWVFSLFSQLVCLCMLVRSRKSPIDPCKYNRSEVF